MKPRRLVLVVALTLIIGACSGDTSSESTSADAPATTAASPNSSGASTGMGQGMGSGSSMQERHRAPIPAEFAGLTNPIPAAPGENAIGTRRTPSTC